jgi:hypothetical protein
MAQIGVRGAGLRVAWGFVIARHPVRAEPFHRSAGGSPGEISLVNPAHVGDNLRNPLGQCPHGVLKDFLSSVHVR